MRWVCPNCELVLQEPQHPIRCHCGTTTDKHGKTVSRGLGDKVAKLTKAVGVKPCGGCKQRQGTLNRLFPNKATQADVLILVPIGASSSFTDTRGTLLGEQLETLGVTTVVHGLNVASQQRIDEVLETVRPRLVINQAMVLTAEAVEHLVARHKRSKWLTINHSSFSDMIRVRNWLPQHANFLNLARDNARCFYGHVDNRQFLERLGVTRAFHVPNCVRIPQAVGVVAPRSPLRLSLVCRPDPLKNVPNQLLACAGVGDVQVLMSMAHDAGHQLEPLVKALALDTVATPWVQWEQFTQWVAAEVDIGLQVSFTESMNYVALEHMLLHKPVVGSGAVRYLPGHWKAEADCPDSITAVVKHLRDNYDVEAAMARSVAVEFAERNNEQFVELVKTRLL